jgi:hypothetical protein
VGIALTNPSTPLDVNGIVRAANAYSLSYAGVAGSTSAFGAGTISTDSNWGMYFRATTGAAIADFAWVNGAGSERMRITSGGDVGIGVTSPASGTLGTAALDVEGPVLARNAISAHQTNAGVFQYRVNETTIRSYGATAGSGQIVFSAGGGGSADTERMRIDSSGNLLVGTTSALASNTHSFINSGSSALTLRHSGSTAGRFWFTGPDSGASFIIYNNNSVGQFMGYGSTSWSSSSDERFKTELTPFADAAEKVCTLRTGTGRYLSDDEGVSRSFLIAQDVQKVLPEAVSQMNDEDGTLALSYTDLIPLLTAAIQEQQAVIKSLEARVAQLEA